MRHGFDRVLPAVLIPAAGNGEVLQTEDGVSG
jgi:hypothetical protein